MREPFEEIRDQIHEIRNIIGPVDIKLETLESHIADCKIFFEQRCNTFESKLAANSIRVDQQLVKTEDIEEQISQLSERVRRIEFELKLPSQPGGDKSLPVHQDKVNPTLL